MNWFVEAWKKYAVFQGRARRREYWFFVLFNTVIAVVLSVVDLMTGTVDDDVGIGLLGGLFLLASIVPSFAVSVRRLHDIGRTGWWVLLGVVPIVGTLVLLVFALLDSEPGANQYEIGRAHV